MTNKDGDTRTEHGSWTPDVSRAADEAMRELDDEPAGTEPATEGVDKSRRSEPAERGIDHQ